MNSSFPELSVVIAIGAALALLMHVLRQPLIIAHILTGIVVGPIAFNILNSQDPSFTTFSSMGIALLLFIIGLDLTLQVFARLRKTIFFTTFVQIIIITLLGYLAGQLLGFIRVESAILGLALALSSTVIIVKLLNDKREMTRLYASIVIGMLLLQDVVATAAKIAIAARADGGPAADIAFLLGRGLLVTVLLYLASRFLVPRLTKTVESSKELLLLFALGWGLGIAALFEYVGFSIEIGALFAGVSLASLPYSREMVSRLKPLRDFFLVIFFITIGQALTPESALLALIPALVLSMFVILVKPFVVLSSLGILGYTKRSSFKAALAHSQISEFSLILVISAAAAGVVSDRLVTVVTLVALFTFVASTYLLKYDNRIYALFEHDLRFFERRFTRLEKRDKSPHFHIVMFGYRKGGREFLKTFNAMNKRYVTVDYDPDVIESLQHQNEAYVYGDATDPDFLDELQLDRSKLIVSNMSDHETNLYLANWLHQHNPHAVFVCSSDTPQNAAELYAHGAAYVMMPHYIGSEKLGSFIRKSELKKSEFNHFRDKHLLYLQQHYAADGA